MQITLARAFITDCVLIHRMQQAAFKPLLEQYRDCATNPGAESLQKIKHRMEQSLTDYYFIRLDNRIIGAVRIVRRFENTCRISPMFILPDYQGKGYAQEAMTQVELLYPDAKTWELDTIKQEQKLCHLYEKMGYRATGREEEIQEGMTIKYYEKKLHTNQ